jgi:hypothetical protein
MNNIFNDTKYTKWYFDLINQRKQKPLQGNIYTETHHILPRKLGGGDNFENLIKLTAREHFITHLLLTKMTNGINKKYMFHALNLMAYTRNLKINSKTYSYIKENYSKENKGNKNIMFGKKGLNLPAYGYKHTKEHKKYISNKLKGRKHSKEAKEKMTRAAMNRKITEQTKEKISKANSGINNPMYDKKHTLETKHKMKKNHANFEGINNPMFGKSYWKGKQHCNDTILKCKLKGYKLSHIYDVYSNEDIFFYGNLCDFCASLNCRAGVLQRTLKTQKPITRGPLKNLILKGYYPLIGV